ncbi:MAG: hypothetical protein ABSE15_00915 [Candidatus Bathyarchaeia archaeon]|jgi:hypothetical protein
MTLKNEDVIDFVLKFHNCNRKYEIFVEPKDALEFEKKIDKANIEITKKFGIKPKAFNHLKEEHNISKDAIEARELYLRTTRAETFVMDYSNGESKFNIIVFPPFQKLPLVEKIRVLIHEARHIVDYPTIKKPTYDLDLALLKEFKKQYNR